MRQYGFKFSIHFMPGLYGSDVDKDIDSFRQAYDDPFFKPDEIKFYPTSVIPNTELYELYRKGEYKPLETEDIVHIIRTVQLDIIPPYTRIKRLIRDIPSTEIAAGSNVTNLRQLTEKEMLAELKSDAKLREKLYGRLYQNAQVVDTLPEQRDAETLIVGQMPDVTAERNFVALDTRAREIRHNSNEHTVVNLVIRKYLSSVGTEYFISYEDDLGYLYGFTRLLLPEEEMAMERDGLGKQTALIRELHVYGQVAKIDSIADDEKSQHKGFGTRLMETAEQIAAQAGYTKMSVIS